MARKLNQKADYLSEGVAIIEKYGPMPIAELSWQIGRKFKSAPTPFELAKRLRMDGRFRITGKLKGQSLWGIKK